MPYIIIIDSSLKHEHND